MYAEKPADEFVGGLFVWEMGWTGRGKNTTIEGVERASAAWYRLLAAGVWRFCGGNHVRRYSGGENFGQ